MKIINDPRSMFKVTRIGESRLLIQSGSVLIPRRRSHFVQDASGYGSFAMQDGTTSTEGSIYQGFITINTTQTEIEVTESGKIYLKIEPSISEDDTNFGGIINLGTGSAEEAIPDYGRGVLLFGKLMKKRFEINSVSDFSFVCQSEDPELDNHDKSMNLDSVSYTDGGFYPDYSVVTHILLAECEISEESMVIRQRHRGPLIIREPIIYYGDFGYRQNLS